MSEGVMPEIPVLTGTFLLTAWVVSGPMAAAATLKPEDVDGFAVVVNQDSVLRWSVESGELPEPIDYTIRDYWGRPVACGRTKAAAGNSVEADVRLAQGFYEIELPATNQQFGVASLPAYAGRRDPFFCVDSALSWLVRDQEVREGLIKILRRSGVAMSRERLAWSQINPAEGKWHWETSARYDTIRRLYAQQQVGLLEMFHDAPGWAGRVGTYPQDLVATAQAWRQVVARWHSTWAGLEVWNEPDIFFWANLSADQYVPLAKMLAYVFDQERIGLPLVGGVFAHCNRTYLRNAAENGLLDCVDAVSFHTYGRALEMEALIGDYRGWLGAHQREAMPLWITECGRPWKRGPDRPPVDQDAASALDVTMKAVEARAGGIARYFAFVYPFFEEGENNFGMMGRRATPLRSLVAYARLASLLAHKRYLGDLQCDDAALRRARVFGDERETVAVLYTARPDASAQVKLGLPVLRVEGIDGRTLEVAEDGSVPIPDGLTYVWLELPAVGDRLQTDSAAMRLGKIARQEPPRRPPPSPIVLRFEPERGVMESKTDGYHLLATTLGKLPLKVRVFNLSAQPRDLTLTLTFAAKSARLIGPQTRPAKVPAEGFADVAWEADLSETLAAGGAAEVTVTAQDKRAGTTAKGGGAIAPLVISLAGQGSLTQPSRPAGGGWVWHPQIPPTAR
jgi:hypothetical protein